MSPRTETWRTAAVGETVYVFDGNKIISAVNRDKTGELVAESRAEAEAWYAIDRSQGERIN